MAHEIDFSTGTASIAYVGETPWHGLGVSVSEYSTPMDMLKAARLDWEVALVPTYIKTPSGEIQTPSKALVRMDTLQILDTVGENWHPVQNQEAFEFFNEFVETGGMSMHTAGALKNGTIVWALARINDGFSLANGRDVVESYLLFTNYHKYGFSTDIRFTNIRVVCNNTLTMAMRTRATEGKAMRVTHHREFNADEVKTTLKLSQNATKKYKEAAQFLSEKYPTKEETIEYFKRICAMTGKGVRNTEGELAGINKFGRLAYENIDKQPGADINPGSWWQVFNAVTYTADHLAGRNDDNRLYNSWYGSTQNLKLTALREALEMAS